jgi:hypothetical protein
MCEAQPGVIAVDGQVMNAPNRYAAIRPDDIDDFPPVMLQTPMLCIRTGARQVLPSGRVPPNDHTKPDRPAYATTHYPNVDIFECPRRKARMVRE